MGPMILQREVLPPRQAPRADSAFDLVSAEEQLRASISRSIWMLVLWTGLASTVVRLLELSL